MVQSTDFETSTLSVLSLPFWRLILMSSVSLYVIILPSPLCNKWWCMNTYPQFRPPLDSRPMYVTATWHHQLMIQRHLKLNTCRTEQLPSPGPPLRAFTPRLRLAKTTFQGLSPAGSATILLLWSEPSLSFVWVIVAGSWLFSLFTSLVFILCFLHSSEVRSMSYFCSKTSNSFSLYSKSPYSDLQLSTHSSLLLVLQLLWPDLWSSSSFFFFFLSALFQDHWPLCYSSKTLTFLYFHLFSSHPIIPQIIFRLDFSASQ